ncbi:MAG: LemA family protein [Fimbriimonadaceae bacterium]|nr:LemA family protein [Chitinophagales bacterium]
MWILLVIVGALLLIGIGLYNTLISRKNNVENAFGTIDAMLKKRFDLIPNLVETVKQYMNYEKDTLSKIVELRNSIQSNPTMPAEERIGIENQLTAQLSQLRIAVENYPDLKANQNFIQLQATWTEIEEQISAARRTYNAAVTAYNNAVQMFPTNIFAGMMNYKTMEVLKIEEAERKNISAKDLFN